MESKIYINNSNIADAVMFQLDKIDNGFTEEELNNVNELVINYDNENESGFTFLSELLKLPKLQSLTIRNAYIYDDNFSIFYKLKDLVNLTFENCTFQDADLIAHINLVELALYNCPLDSYSFVSLITSLKKLTIVKGKASFKLLNVLTNLEYLQLTGSEIFHLDEYKLFNIKYLYIDHTNIKDLSFVKNISSLKSLSIDEEQYRNNKDLVNELINRNIEVLQDTLIPYSGDNHES